MKVRYKHYTGPHDYTIVEESPSYYILRDGCGTLRHGKKADYEPVQEWEDVTHECTLKASAHGAYSIYRLGYVIQTSNTCHRVTCTGSTFKVEVLK